MAVKKYLRTGGNPHNPKDYENCTKVGNCQRHIHLEKLTTDMITQIAKVIEAPKKNRYSVMVFNWNPSSRGKMTFEVEAFTPKEAFESLKIDSMLQNGDIVNIFQDKDSGKLDEDYYPIIVPTVVGSGIININPDGSVNTKWSEE
jgi:hypothetical protein